VKKLLVIKFPFKYSIDSIVINIGRSRVPMIQIYTGYWHLKKKIIPLFGCITKKYHKKTNYYYVFHTSPSLIDILFLAKSLAKNIFNIDNESRHPLLLKFIAPVWHWNIPSEQLACSMDWQTSRGYL